MTWPATSLLVFMGATLALNLTPGPDMLYVAARSGSEGRRAGLLSALGIAAGCMVHVLAVSFGLSRVLDAVPRAFLVVQYAGAAYLVYLAVRAYRSSAPAPGPALRPASPIAVFRQGVVTNVLNPKVALFFLAFLPQFVDARAGAPWLQLLLLGLLFNASGTLVNAAVAIFASRAGEWLRSGPHAARWLQHATAALFLGLGVRLALLRR